jgi:hypothetical protein
MNPFEFIVFVFVVGATLQWDPECVSVILSADITLEFLIVRNATSPITLSTTADTG